MAVYEGHKASVTLAGTTLGIVKRCTIRTEADKSDITGMAGTGSAGWRSFAPTLRTWSVTIEGVLDSADAGLFGSNPNIRAGATGAFSCTFATGKSYSGNVIIDSVEPEVSADDTVTYTIQCTGNGALTYPT